MLEGKKIIVTGASRGIGYAIAIACAEAGAVVGLNSRTSPKAVAILCEREPDRYIALPFDVQDTDGIANAFASFRERTGRLDGLVNNAGVNTPSLLLLANKAAVREQIEVNLLGPIWCTQAALPLMLEQGAGVIVNVSSVAAVRPVQGQAAYAAAKGGVEAFTRAVALEYARKGIRAVGIRPGPVETEMIEGSIALVGEDGVLARIPLRRLGRPKEIADLAVFLLSDRAAFMTGSIHTADGGYLEA